MKKTHHELQAAGFLNAPCAQQPVKKKKLDQKMFIDMMNIFHKMA